MLTDVDEVDCEIAEHVPGADVDSILDEKL